MINRPVAKGALGGCAPAEGGVPPTENKEKEKGEKKRKKEEKEKKKKEERNIVIKVNGFFAAKPKII